MSATAQTKPRPRIIIEMQDDGTLVIESYTNGQRSREVTYRGFEMVAIREELDRQRRQIDNAAEEKRLRLEREEAARHRRVWNQTAFGHANNSRGFGIAFANKTIGPIGRTPKEPTVPTDAVVASVDLL